MIRGITLGDVNKDLPLSIFPPNPASRGITEPGAHDVGAPPHESPYDMAQNCGFAFGGLRRAEASRTFAPDSILRLNSVINITGLSRSSIYSYIKVGNFPRPRKLSARSVGWLASEIFEWVASRGHNA